MDSALRPRDIQARIRAGESVDEVARAAGVPVEKIEPFAAPVVAERQHVAGLALSNPVRRRGETTSHRPLRSAATESLVARGIDPDDVSWDAALLGSRRWQVRATFIKGDRHHEAMFVYDQQGRFSVAGNDDARWMIGESTRHSTEAVGVPLAQEDDELAIVRAIQDPPPAEASDINDAYSETELAEVDGLYDIVAGDDPEMDALYDMLASFDEDSVKIYSGLVRPDLMEPALPGEPQSAPSAQTPPLPEGARVQPVYVPDDVRVRQHVSPTPDTDETGDAEPTIVLEPEQPALMDVEPEPAKKPVKKGRRASVPSWDEIMFGSPRKGPDKH